MIEDDKKKIILPNGKEFILDDQQKTERSKERIVEDKSFVPVIIKRNDETIRHPDDILEMAIEEGLIQHKRTHLSLFISAIAAGLILGFVSMCVALASQFMSQDHNFILKRLTIALVYPLGFVICIMSRTQLFTDHTATAFYPVLDKKASIKSLFLVWFYVLLGNLLGTLTSTFLIYLSEAVIGAEPGYVIVADHLIFYKFPQIFISAILAGWLMAQGGWLVLATSQASAQIICIYIVTFIIGLGGLHHSIAGSAEIFSGIFHAQIPNYLGSFKFLVGAILGNLVGGSLFVASLNYAHIKKTG